MEQTYYHVHAMLVVVANGGTKVVPAGTGIADPHQQNGYVTSGSCFYWLHAHANDGVIHIEAPQGTNMTLGNYFDIWGETLSSTQVGPYTGRVVVYVDGVRRNVDPNAIPLTACRQIQLDVGNTAPPQTYGFPSGLGC